MEAKISRNEVRCGKCGHLLMKVTAPFTAGGFEIKCHSCKSMQDIKPNNQNGDAFKYQGINISGNSLQAE